MVLNKFISKFAMLAFGLAFWACTENNTAGTSEESEGIVAIKDREIAGVSQKGPFLTGSSVTVQELDGRTFVQTGKSFRASIKNNLGDFVVKGVTLASQYALLEVNGYYRNEISGERSKGMIALNALTDLSDRNHVNVNMLTHFVTDRILNLVQKGGVSFKDAKKQAETEVLASFGVLENIGDVEDLDLFTGDGGAFLLAVSVLMQGNGSEADLSERIAHVAAAFAESGAWESPEKTEIADWSFRVENGFEKSGVGINLLEHIRKNVESWGVVDSVPNFEIFINKFWAHEYGLGACSDNNVYEVKRNENALSEYYNVEFTCNPSGRWSWVRMRELQNNVYEEVPVPQIKDDVYKAVKIGKNFWMAENARPASVEGDYFDCECYDSNKLNCDVYGVLCPFEKAEDVCPIGYGLPEPADVEDLLQSYGGPGMEAAQALRAMDGFGALYAGSLQRVMSTTLIEGINEKASFWISDRTLLKIDSTGARVEPAEYGVSEETFRLYPVKASVRCIKK
jgi:uncharacterized protein (TIGR02145 family)